MKIYCCHPISGMTADEVFEYYEEIERVLESFGYDVLTPMHGKDVLRTELTMRAGGYHNPESTNHAIFCRDRWMVGQADIVFANLLKATKLVSIGSMMEMAWASELRKHVVLCMQEENIHRHAFVMEASSVIYTEFEPAMKYLKALAGRLRRST